MRTIDVSVEVYAAIWRNHQAGEATEDEILQRLLRVKNQGKEAVFTKGKKTRWIEDVIEGFRRIGGDGHYEEIYRSVLDVRKENGHTIPVSFEAIVRKEIEYHSSDSGAYKGERDLFTAPNGLGAGYWKLR